MKMFAMALKKPLCCLIALVLMAGCLMSVSAESTIGLLKHMDVDGVDYIAKTDVTTVLLMGVDRPDGERARFREGGQADFLLLVVIDHDAKQVRQLQLERDCMAEIQTVGVLGNVNGSRVEQLCLAYGMGDGYEMSCELQCEAVSKLLLDTEIDLYASIPMAGIGIVNDALGGVTVVLPEDFTAMDPQMEKGAKLTLDAKQAEILVRSRMEVGDGTNASRMQRQQVYMKAATSQFRAKMKENINFADTMLDALDGVMVANFSRGRIINELNRAYQYDILPVENLAGEYTIGEDGFREFHADGEALRAWVVETFYTPNN